MFAGTEWKGAADKSLHGDLTDRREYAHVLDLQMWHTVAAKQLKPLDRNGGAIPPLVFGVGRVLA